MPKFKSRVVEIEAVRWDGSNQEEVKAFAGDSARFAENGALELQNPNGWGAAQVGDHVLTAGPGDFYACPDDVFQRKYETA
jgi:hypothetical protein